MVTETKKSLEVVKKLIKEKEKKLVKLSNNVEKIEDELAELNSIIRSET